jgi:hypothetical protein
MDDSEMQEERADLISRMFALITAKLEDAATIAVECQGRRANEELCNNAMKIQDLCAEATTVTEAVTALLG